MGHGGQQVLTIGVEMSFQGIFVTADKLPAIAGALDRQTRYGFFLYADVGGPPVVLENLLQIGGRSPPPRSTPSNRWAYSPG